MAGSETNAAGRAMSVARRFGLQVLVLVPALVVPGRVLHSQLAVGRVEVVMQVGDRANREAAISVRNESDKPVQAVVKLEDWDRAEDGSNRWFPY